MKKTLLALTVSLAGAVCAYAAPNLFTYQGRLKEGGLAVTGNRTVEIFLCNAETGPTCTTTQPQPVAVTNGLFRSTFTIPSSLDLGTGSWWLEIKVGANTLAPREQLASNAYALFSATAAFAQSVSAAPGSNGVYISTNLYVTGGGKFVGDGSALTNLPVSGGAVAKAGDTMTGQLTLANSTLTVTGNAFSVGGSTLAVAGGNVGIGTLPTTSKLDIRGSNPVVTVEHNGSPFLDLVAAASGLGSSSIDFDSLGDLLIRAKSSASKGDPMSGTELFAFKNSGSLGVGTTAPLSKFDVMGGSITIRGANAALVFEDSRRVISSETATAVGAGIRVSTNVYIVGFSSAAKYYGDGSALTNLPASGGAVARAGDTMTGSLSLLNASTLTVAGNAFSVGGSTLMVAGGSVGINMAPAVSRALSIAPAFGDADGIVELYNSSGKFAQLRMRGTPALDILTNTGSGGIQFSPGGAGLAYLKPGLVGINTPAPAAMLHVESGSFTITGALAAYPYVVMAGDNGIVISTGGAIQTAGAGHGGVAGNPRGMGAVDLQTRRTLATQVASGLHSAIAGGEQNTASGSYSFAVGQANKASGFGAAVSGGYSNVAGQTAAAVTGGLSNTAGGFAATVSGGRENAASGESSFVGGGGRDGSGYPASGNAASQKFAAVVGGAFNVASGSNSFVGGGAYNAVSGTSSVVSGGENNTAGALWSAVGGGRQNFASNDYAVVAGGSGNTAGGANSAVSGGVGNSASASGAFVGGGQTNNASGQYSAIGGGASNAAGANYATVPGGSGNTANGSNSFAAGQAADSTSNNTFTWNDSGGTTLSNLVADRTVFKNKGGFVVTGSTNMAMTGALNRGVFISGTGLVGIATGAPQAALDVVSSVSAAGAYAQIWRDSGGIIVASMNAVGVLNAGALTTTGNVGVGTMNPGAKLDIQGPGSGGLDEFAGLRVVNTNFNLNQLTSINLASGNGTILGAIKSKLYTATNYGDLTFWTWSNPTMVQRMIIDNLGNVGINTPAPQAALHVNGNLRVNGPAELGDATASGNQPAVVWLQNNTGSAVSSGSLVIAFGNNGFNTTTSASTTSVVGVTYDNSIAAGSAGRVAVAGVVSVSCNTTALVGQHVVASALPGKADSTNAPASGASIGRWLENCTSPGMGRVLLR